MKSFVRYWLPLVLWMGLIFTASADAESVARSSRILGPFLRWLKPDISEEAVENIRLVARKCAHFVEYAVLAWLWWRALRSRSATGEVSWTIAGIVLLICVLYAVTDEWHQLFVDGRTGSPVDVCIDAVGAAVALLLLKKISRPRPHPA